MVFIAITLFFFLFESVLQFKEITNNILMFFMLLFELRNECCMGKRFPYTSLKCFVNISRICVNCYSYLTTKKTFEVAYNNNTNNNNNNNISLGSWCSACCGLPRIRFPTPDTCKWSFSSPKLSDRIMRSPGLPFNGYRGPFFPGAERQGREANHSLPSTTEVKNDENCISVVPEEQLYLHLTPSVSSNFLTHFTTRFLEVASGTLEYFQ